MYEIALGVRYNAENKTGPGLKSGPVLIQYSMKKTII